MSYGHFNYYNNESPLIRCWADDDDEKQYSTVFPSSYTRSHFPFICFSSLLTQWYCLVSHLDSLHFVSYSNVCVQSVMNSICIMSELCIQLTNTFRSAFFFNTGDTWLVDKKKQLVSCFRNWYTVINKGVSCDGDYLSFRIIKDATLSSA